MLQQRESLESFGAELLLECPRPQRWTHCWLTGFWYGPVPVGLLSGLVAALLLIASRQ